MPTFAELKTRISKRLKDPSNTAVSADDVGTSINDAINYWKHHPFFFNETSTVITLTVGNPTLTLPSDFLYETTDGALSIDYSNQRWPITKVSNDVYQCENVEGNGLPYIYAYREGSIVLYYYPDQAYSLTLRYIKDYADLSADSDTNDFTTYADQLIMYDALSRLMAEFRQDAKMADYYFVRAKNEANNLFKRANRNKGTGTLSVDQL